jgi:hypothetical protein
MRGYCGWSALHVRSGIFDDSRAPCACGSNASAIAHQSLIGVIVVRTDAK